ncbi:MAG: hypothetical protein JSR82_22530 [Verrucomicrobia bacterium]|nr:hypothetical protein [Verrucomicrobiota bacterium]
MTTDRRLTEGQAIAAAARQHPAAFAEWNRTGRPLLTDASGKRVGFRAAAARVGYTAPAAPRNSRLAPAR